MSRFLSLVFCLLFFAIAHAETVDRVVAVVGNEIITLYDLDRAMAPYVGEIKKSASKEEKFKDIKSEMLNRLIDDLLLKQAIEDVKIEVTGDDLARAIRNVLAQNHITIEILKSELGNKGVSFEAYKDDLKRNIQRIKFVNQEIGPKIKMSDQDMRDYYQKHKEEFGAHQSVHIAQIVLPFNENTTEAAARELKAKAEDIVAQIHSGTPFASLAGQHSKGPNPEGGGDLGVINPDNLMPEISAVIKNMKVGEISKPIISPAGVHIINLIDRAQPTEADFAKLKDKVYDRMYEQKVTEELNRYLAESRKKSYVEIRD